MDEQKMKNFHRIWIGAIVLFVSGALMVVIYFGILGKPVKENEKVQRKNNVLPVSNLKEEKNESDDIKEINIENDMKIKSPLIISGEARGWYFEGVFPITLVNENGKNLGRTNAKAQSDWMTDDFVPFEATLLFGQSAAKKGKIIFEKSNPSGLPDNRKIFEIPVNF